jgi:hypothetical protein
MRRWRDHMTPWSMCCVWFRKTLIDGSRASGLLMRRYVNGEAQYRRMTQEDEAEARLDMA